MVMADTNGEGDADTDPGWRGGSVDPMDAQHRKDAQHAGVR